MNAVYGIKTKCVFKQNKTNLYQNNNLENTL